MPQTFVLPRQVVLTDGAVAPGAVARFYQTGTTTPQAVYTDASLTTAVTSITADAAGMFQKVYINPNASFNYRVRVETASGVLIYQEDDIDRLPVSQAAIGAALYPRTSAEQSAGVTPTSYVYPQGDIRRYGAVADGNFETGAGTDNSAAIQTAIDLCAELGGNAVYIPAGIYKCASQITVDDGLSIIGDGMWSSILFAPTAFANTGGLVRINGTTGYPTVVKGVGILAQVGGSGGSGLVSVKNGVFIEDVWVNGFSSGTGITISSTDNFLHNFLVELCNVGMYVTDRHINISHGSVYRNNVGALIANGAAVDVGRVHIESVRATEGDTVGFDLDGAEHVSLVNCSATHVNAGKFVTAGIRISNSSNDIIIDGFKGHLGTVSTTAYGIQGASSSNITITGGSTTGWLDGVRMAGISGLTITGGQHYGNGRIGVYAAGGDQVNVSGVNAYGNGGAGTSDAGIYLDNTASFATYKVSGCVCSQASGGAQEYGLYLSITDNGSNSGHTLATGNICTFNGTANISYNGRTERIIGGGNHPGSMAVVASAATITLPGYTDTVSISGTTNITAISAAQAGRRVTLIFQDVLTFTDGSNLVLAGDFATTNGDTITLVCDGTSWYEVGRSVN